MLKDRYNDDLKFDGFNDVTTEAKKWNENKAQTATPAQAQTAMGGEVRPTVQQQPQAQPQAQAQPQEQPQQKQRTEAEIRYAYNIPDNKVYNGTNYDSDTDYSLLIHEAEKAGDYAEAARLEKQRNAKIIGDKMGYATTNEWYYNNPEGDRAERAALDKINSIEPFDYDYTKDPVYIKLRQNKEKEAQKAYEDAYAKAAARNGGVVPADELKNLQTLKQDIINSADNQIAALRNLAYSQYRDEISDLYNRYGLVKNKNDYDRAQWQAERDARISGKENAYGRDYRTGRDAVADAVDVRNFYENVREFDAGMDYNRDNTMLNYNLNRQGDIASLAASLAKEYGWDRAVEIARSMYPQLSYGAGASSPAQAAQMQGAQPYAAYSEDPLAAAAAEVVSGNSGSGSSGGSSRESSGSSGSAAAASANPSPAKVTKYSNGELAFDKKGNLIFR